MIYESWEMGECYSPRLSFYSSGVSAMPMCIRACASFTIRLRLKLYALV